MDHAYPTATVKRVRQAIENYWRKHGYDPSRPDDGVARAAIAATLRHSVKLYSIPVNLPFERVPQHARDPGYGPVPPLPKVQPLFEDTTPDDARSKATAPSREEVAELIEELQAEAIRLAPTLQAERCKRAASLLRRLMP